MNSDTSIALPYFSVVIATYNRAALLSRALDSLLSQTEKDWEAIVVDDGSTDNTSQTIAPYLKKEKRIKYVKKDDNSGEASTKNTGIHTSIGKFITFLDSDDEYHINHLEIRKGILMKNPRVQFLYGGMEITGNQYVPHRHNKNEKIHLNDCVAGGTFFVERNTLLQLKGFKEIALGTDADLFERAQKANISIQEVETPSYIYHRENPDSITNSWKMIV